MVKLPEHVHKFFTEADALAVTEAVQEAESLCAVEFRVAVAHSRQKDTMKLASRIYRKLGIGKATDEPGLLVLLLPARREFVLWGNDKVNQAISQEKWCAAKDAAIPLLAGGRQVEAVRAMLQMLVKALAHAFPPGKIEADELPDKPVEIR
jgi:uncharacterized membrane protein